MTLSDSGSAPPEELVCIECRTPIPPEAHYCPNCLTAASRAVPAGELPPVEETAGKEHPPGGQRPAPPEPPAGAEEAVARKEPPVEAPPSSRGGGGDRSGTLDRGNRPPPLRELRGRCLAGGCLLLRLRRTGLDGHLPGRDSPGRL